MSGWRIGFDRSIGKPACENFGSKKVLDIARKNHYFANVVELVHAPTWESSQIALG